MATAARHWLVNTLRTGSLPTMSVVPSIKKAGGHVKSSTLTPISSKLSSLVK